MTPFYNETATVTSEQIEAAKSTINLEDLINKFIQQSQAFEQSNKRLTCYIIILSIIQVAVAIIAL